MERKSSGVTGRAMGAMKQARQAVAGRSGIFRTLAEEHGEISALIKRARLTGGDNPESIRERTDLFNEIRTRLLTHAKAEETVFYERLKAFPETRELAQEGQSEHGELEALLDGISKIAPSAPGWIEQLEALEETVQHHVSEEENELFPKAQELLSDEETASLDTAFEREKATVLPRIQQHP